MADKALLGSYQLALYVQKHALFVFNHARQISY